MTFSAIWADVSGGTFWYGLRLPLLVLLQPLAAAQVWCAGNCLAPWRGPSHAQTGLSVAD
jgi:hypothetical protein